MKTIFLIFTGLLSMYFSGYSQCGFQVSIEQCCVTVSVIPNAYPRWMIEFGDDHIITSSEVDSTVATHCFEGGPGSYKIVLTYLDEYGNHGCGADEIIFINEACDCVQWLCWDMLANCCVMDTIKGFEIMVNGNPVIIPLTPTYVAGAYQWLSDTLVTILESYNYGGEFYSSFEPVIKKCKKGNDVIPGFFFVNSSIQIVRILGVVDCNFPNPPPDWREAKVEFKSGFCNFD
ncbi:MAG: hypothetical protein IPM26_04025 [Saprospiraceae bacterium]|nr:hypothetical protein [Saprospiraceae bacterium]